MPNKETSYSAIRSLEKAESLWNSGRQDFALKTLYAALTKAPNNSDLWLSLHQKYDELGEETSAALAARTAFEVDPRSVIALSVLCEVAQTRNWRGEVTRAYRKFAEQVKEDPSLERDALMFFIPSKFKLGIEILEASSDPVVQAVLKLSRKDGIESIPLTQAQLQEVELRDNLIFGRQNQAINNIHTMPHNHIPINALKITARRYLRTTKRNLANALLTEIARLDLKDGWARRNLEKVTDSQLSNYQLAKVGFPFTPASASPSYQVNPNRSLYLLHNSLPYHSAGYSTRTHGLLKSVRELGWDVQGVTRLGYPFDMPKFEETKSIPPIDLIDGVPYHRLSTSEGIEKKAPIQAYARRYSEALEKLVITQKPFVLHAASNHWNGLTAVETANRLGIPSIYEVRGLWEVTRGSRDPEWAKGGMYRFMARMEADAAKNATRVFTITNALRDELVSRGVPSEKITVLPNGVDAARFQPVKPDNQLKAQLGLTGRTIIGYVGSVLDYEGLGLLIEAAAILKQRHDNFAVMIVGDGAELEKFQQQVKDADVSDVFVFTGRVPHEEVERYYSIIDITPFPRLPLPVCEMVSPLKPFEAMAMEKAVIASDVQALTEIVRDGKTGLLHKKGSAESLADQINRYLVDENLMKKMARAGREWVVAERQWKDLGKIVSDTYAELGGSESS